MKVLVLGGTGMIGNAIVRELLDSGHEVSGTCRSSQVAPNLAGLSLQVLHGDLDTPGQLDHWVSGHDVVIDAATPYPLHLLFTAPGREKPTLAYARRRTSRLLASVITHGAKLVYISTLLAQPERPGKGLPGMQRRLMRVLHPYFAIKANIEQQLLNAMDRAPGIMIIQPSACLGPFDVKPKDQCLVPNLINGKFSISIDHPINLIDSRDVAKGIVAAIDAGRFGETIRLSGHNTSIKDTLAVIARLGGNPVTRQHIPAALGVLPTYWSELAWATIGRPSPLPSLLPVLICEQHWLATSAAQRALGVDARPLDHTLQDTVSWYQSLGYC